MIPRFGEPPEARRHRLRPGAYALLVRDGRVLLTLQHAPQREYQLPGGGIDPGESQQQALHREVLEETGWRIGYLRHLGSYRRFCFMPDYDFWAEKLCTIWLARPVLRMGPPREPGHDAIWAPIWQVPSLLVDAGSRAFALRHLDHGGGTGGAGRRSISTAEMSSWRRPPA